jgi:hypothetical protein
MTREDTKKLLMAIEAAYPNFKPENASLTVDTWLWALEEYPAEAVKGALQIYLKTNNTGFAPSVSQLIGCIHAPKENEQLSEGEAWALVKKAIQNGNYGSEEEFAKLPPIVQRAVGGSQMIRQWAMCETNEVNNVIASNFMRTYRAILSKQSFGDKVPPQLSDMVKGLSEQVSGERYLRIAAERDDEDYDDDDEGDDEY